MLKNVVQVFGNPVQLERLDMRHRPRLPQPSYVRYGCMGTHVHEYAFRRKRTLAPVLQCDLQCARPREATVAENQFSSG